MIKLDDGTEVVTSDALILWSREVTKNYEGVNITNLNTSWVDGLAIAAIAHSTCGPEYIDWNEARRSRPAERWTKAHQALDEKSGIPQLLDVEDITNGSFDENCVITFLDLIKKENDTNSLEKNLNVKKSNEKNLTNQTNEAEEKEQKIMLRIREFVEKEELCLSSNPVEPIKKLMSGLKNEVQDLNNKVSGLIENLALFYKNTKDKKASELYKR